MAAAGLLAESVRFAYYGLADPHKDDVIAAQAPDRRLRAFLIDVDSGESTDVVVSLTRQRSSAPACWIRARTGRCRYSIRTSP